MQFRSGFLFLREFVLRVRFGEDQLGEVISKAVEQVRVLRFEDCGWNRNGSSTREFGDGWARAALCC